MWSESEILLDTTEHASCWRNPTRELSEAGQPARACLQCVCFFFSSRRRHTRLQGDWSSDVCSSDLAIGRRIIVVSEPYAARIVTGVTDEPRIAVGVGRARFTRGPGPLKNGALAGTFLDRKSVV